ncbi:type II toxin-antitoxin system HicA family toxin [Jiella pelagia]|uniref:type II toxin-antitoxin system HicA family toxin n=1 Tax=Jiella pelagia TaxID=2986949 RepID=UPI0038B2851F
MGDYDLYEKVIRILREHDFELVRHTGSNNELWRHPVSRKTVTVPIRMKSRESANAILKGAGVGKTF